MNKEQRQFINSHLPVCVCGNPKIPCGRRKSNKGCRLEACGYAIKTVGIKDEDKAFLLAYARINI